MSAADLHAPVTSAFSGRRWRRSQAQAEEAESTIDPGPVDGHEVYERSKYLAGQVSLLMARYVRIRGDLVLEHASLDDSDVTKQRAALFCKSILCSAKAELESRRPNLTVVANLLGLAERMLVTLYRREILRLRLQTSKSQLQALTPLPTTQIAAIRVAANKMDLPEEDDREVIETALKDAITYINGCAEQELLEDDLQVSRLSMLLGYMIFAWALLVIAVPAVSAVQTSASGEVVWPVVAFGRGEFVDLIAGALGLSIVGAVGGVVSGLFKVRDSRATMLDYRSSIKRLALKPIVGAVAALVVYLFLSAQVISGVEVTSAGTYVVLAFIAGFSERYFLSVLNAQTEALGQPRPGPATTAAAEEPVP